eukprot:11133951-Lingulodinium_polyedra.AAC.1
MMRNNAPLGVLLSISLSFSAPPRRRSRKWCGIASPSLAACCHRPCTASASAESNSAEWLAVRAPLALIARRRSSIPARAMPVPSKSDRRAMVLGAASGL